MEDSFNHFVPEFLILLVFLGLYPHNEWACVGAWNEVSK
jgi:hypothetical protein